MISDTSEFRLGRLGLNTDNPSVGNQLLDFAFSPISTSRRIVRCLVGYGASLDIVEAVVLAELSRLWKAVEKKWRRRFDLVGANLVAAQA
jgi:hypothetical protein